MAWASVLDRLGANKGHHPGIHLEAGLHGPKQDISAPSLIQLARLASDTFYKLGVRPGDRVVTLLPTGLPLLQCILGAWAAAAIVSVVAPAIGPGRSSLSLERLRAMLALIAPRVIVTQEDPGRQIGQIADALGAHLIASSTLPIDGVPDNSPVPNAPNDIAFIQFTSGSTGLPKAIAIEHEQLITNVLESAERIVFDTKSTMVSWLPIHHDLGFVPGLMLPLACSGRLVQIPTESFMKFPLLWLQSIEEHGATHSLAPPFACHLLSKPVFAERAGELDLSSLRYLGLGGEPVSWQVVTDFERAYAHTGLRPGATRAAFGMAEATLAVSSTAPFMPRRVFWANKAALFGKSEVIAGRPLHPSSLALLSNGPAVGSLQIKIVSADGNDCPEGKVGRMLISGPCVVRRYFGSDENPLIDGWLDTGDIGFLKHGELYIAGRAKDVIIRGGVNVHAHEIEETVLRGLPDLAQRVVAFAIPRAMEVGDEVVVGIELRRSRPTEDLAATVAQIISKDLGLQIDHVVALPKGAIPRTTSGKNQRGKARELYCSGELLLTERKLNDARLESTSSRDFSDDPPTRS